MCAIVSSTAAIVFAVGTFMAMMPLLEQPSISTLSTPTPALTIAFSFLPASKNASFTSVELLVIATSASPKIFKSSSFGVLTASITFISCSFFKSSKPTGCIASQTMIVFIILPLSHLSGYRKPLAAK